MPNTTSLTINCRLCNSETLEDIISLGELYLSDFVDDDVKPPASPLSLVLCTSCLLLQLKHTTHSSLLYTENYGYKSGINKTMRNELREIAKKTFAKVKNKKEKIVVVDIGANDGTSLKYYPSHVTKVGVEPIKKLAEECKKQADIVINDFFNYKAYQKAVVNKKAMIVSAISCFYDMEQPNEFVADVSKILDPDGVFVIQQNYLKSMLELNAFDNIVHEHLEYYSLHSLKNLLDRHDMEVFDVEINNTNGGSFRTFIAFKNKRKIDKSVTQLLALEKEVGLDKKKTYKEFAKRIKSNKKILRDFVQTQVKKGKKVYVYGASTRGNTLLQYFKLDKKLIARAVERNPEKWGKKIASVSIPIISEEDARKERPDFMLVLPWFFREEFLEREKSYLESGGQFIFPLPQFHIVSVKEGDFQTSKPRISSKKKESRQSSSKKL